MIDSRRGAKAAHLRASAACRPAVHWCRLRRGGVVLCDTARPMSPRPNTPPAGTKAAAVVQFRGAKDPPLLLRIPVTSAIWAEGLPPLPEGLRVTAAFSDIDAEVEHSEALELLGYESVGVRPSATSDPASVATVDLLIPRRACDKFPLWRDALLDSGGRVWDLGFGPVAARLAQALSAHDGK